MGTDNGAMSPWKQQRCRHHAIPHVIDCLCRMVMATRERVHAHARIQLPMVTHSSRSAHMYKDSKTTDTNRIMENRNNEHKHSETDTSRNERIFQTSNGTNPCAVPTRCSVLFPLAIMLFLVLLSMFASCDVVGSARYR